MTEILLYTSENRQIKVEMLIENETMWLPQSRIAELFGTTKQNVGQHFKNIFAENELDEKTVVKYLFTTASDGKKYKNLTAEELDMYNRIVTMYLDFAELQAKSKNIMYQKEWIEKLSKFLMLNDKEVLQNNGTVTAQLAKELAEREFTKYKEMQDSAYLSDFDHLLLKLEKR